MLRIACGALGDPRVDIHCFIHAADKIMVSKIGRVRVGSYRTRTRIMALGRVDSDLALTELGTESEFFFSLDKIENDANDEKSAPQH